MWKSVTVIVILVTIIAVGGYDLFVAFTPEKGDTISEILLEASMRRPIIPFVFGVVAGHLTWPQRIKERK